MTRIIKYRENGAIGALLDEYEKAVSELKNLLQTVTQAELKLIVDAETEDEDCRSIQTILAHVVRAGKHYVYEIRKWKGEDIQTKSVAILESIKEYQLAIDEMFLCNVRLFEDYPNIKLEENESSRKISVVWGQDYDLEQLMEHAIVHVLRHRRQIERFLVRMRR